MAAAMRLAWVLQVGRDVVLGNQTLGEQSMSDVDTVDAMFRPAKARQLLGGVGGSCGKRFLFGLVALGLFLGITRQAEAQPNYRYTTFSAPDAFLTFTGGINDAGQIVGSYFVSSNGQFGRQF